MASLPFRLNAALDREALGRVFRTRRRLHIPDFLEPAGAEALLKALEGSADWKLLVNQGKKVIELNRSSLTTQARAKMSAAVYAGAQRGFQFRFESIKAPHADADRIANPTAVNEFARFMSSDEVVGFLRYVTGETGISFADAQATAYGPGDFLTTHDDHAPNQKRLVAYVFGLTKEWPVEWGGLLTFHDDISKIAVSLIPAFNALNLFSVPQPHSVSFVTPFAARRRYSVTGWLRGGVAP